LNEVRDQDEIRRHYYKARFPRARFPRKRVTVIAGFQCTDGVMMCSDTEQITSVNTKSPVRKISLLPMPKGFLLIGGAGDGALIDYTLHSLLDYLSKTAFDWSNIEGVLNAHARYIFRSNIKPYSTFPADFIPDLSLMIGVEMEGRTGLFKWERNFAYLIPPMQHIAIGIGTLQAEPMLAAQQFFVPSDQMLFYAVRLMLKVKQLVQGCGSKTEVAVLRSNGTALKYATTTVDAIETLAEEIDQFYLSEILTLISNVHMDEKSIEEQLKPCMKELEKFRKRYVDLVPFSIIPIQAATPSISQKSTDQP